MDEKDKNFIKSLQLRTFRKEALSESIILIISFFSLGIITNGEGIKLYFPIVLAAFFILISILLYTLSLNEKSAELIRHIDDGSLREESRIQSWQVSNQFKAPFSTIVLVLFLTMLACMIANTTWMLILLSTIFFGTFALVFSSFHTAFELKFFLTNMYLNNQLNQNVAFERIEDKFQWKRVLLAVIVLVIIFVIKFHNAIRAFIENMPST